MNIVFNLILGVSFASRRYPESAGHTLSLLRRGSQLHKEPFDDEVPDVHTVNATNALNIKLTNISSQTLSTTILNLVNNVRSTLCKRVNLNAIIMSLYHCLQKILGGGAVAASRRHF